MFSIPDLPYELDALEPYIDKETMKIHHDLHHGTYVKNLNDALSGHDDLLSMDVNDLLKNLDKVPEDIRTKIRNNGGGHANHSLFWTIMTTATQEPRTPRGPLAEAINKEFGNLEMFQEKFAAAGLGRFGSGWVWLTADSEKRIAISDTPNQDTPFMEGKSPILGLDVWEHAYYLKYQNRRADYIKAWWNVVNWKQVEGNFKKAHSVV